MAKKKLNKNFKEGAEHIVTIEVIEGSNGMQEFDPAQLSEEIRERLLSSGLSHKLGDSAAGKDPADAEEAITKVWEGLKNGDWTVRAPAAPKVSVKTITNNLDELSADEKAAAITVLQQLGISLPGITPEEPTEA